MRVYNHTLHDRGTEEVGRDIGVLVTQIADRLRGVGAKHAIGIVDMLGLHRSPRRRTTQYTTAGNHFIQCLL